MSERLEDIFNQADKLLDEAEKERKKAQEVANLQKNEDESVLKFRNAPPIKKRPLNERYPRLIGFLTLICVALIGFIVFMKVSAPKPTGTYHIITGIVEGTRYTSTRSIYGGHVEVATVSLPDGRKITVRIDSGAMIPVGTKVPLRVYDDGAMQLVHSI